MGFQFIYLKNPLKSRIGWADQDHFQNPMKMVQPSVSNVNFN